MVEPQDWWWDGRKWHAVTPGQLAPTPDEQAFLGELRKMADAVPTLTTDQVRAELVRFKARHMAREEGGRG